MDWKYIFTSFDGRITRRQFWLAVLVMIVVSIVISLVAAMVTGGFNAPPATDADSALAAFRAACWANIIVFIIISWPIAAVMIKRRHDRGSSGIEVWIYIGVALVAQLLTAVGFDYSAVMMPGTDAYVVMPGFIAGALGFIVGIFALYLLVVCGFLKGNEGSNTYGPDPLGGGE